MNVVLDTGPMMAYLNNEEGAEVVAGILSNAANACYAHVYNLCEVYYLYYRRGGSPAADSAVQDLIDIGVKPRGDLDTVFWKEAGALKARHAVALPDAFCLALGRRLGATVVTTDHAEFDALVPLAYCPILFIR